MIVIFGLIILLAAVIIGVAGVLGNDGSGHALTHGFSVFGYHVTGSTGTLFLTGIVVGVACPGRAEPATGRRTADLHPPQHQPDEGSGSPVARRPL